MNNNINIDLLQNLVMEKIKTLESKRDHLLNEIIELFEKHKEVDKFIESSRNIKH